MLYPPLKGEGREPSGLAFGKPKGELRERGGVAASPHPGSHFASLNALRPSPLRGG